VVECAGLENRNGSVSNADNTSTSDGDEETLPVSLPVAVQIHPDLATLIDRWPMLPEPLRQGIMAMVRAATPATE
jgi:hypothetical protein